MEKEIVRNKFSYFFWVFLFIILFILGVFLYRSLNKPSHYISPTLKRDITALRGQIVTDKFTLSKSGYVYGVYILPKYIDPLKKELFIKLFSVYSDVPQNEIRKKLSGEGDKNTLLAVVDLKKKQDLIYLRKVLDKLRVFKLDKKSGYRIGYSIENLEFERIYPYDDVFEPFLGRYRKDVKKGENGIEAYYDKFLRAKRDGFIEGKRDVFGNIVFDKELNVSPVVNGDTIKLNINLILQRRIEKLLDKRVKEFNASEVIAAVMDSKTGKIIAIASSNRYDPDNITQKEIKNMRISAIREAFEPGSVMKPFLMAVLLENKKVRLDEVINGYNGYWKPKWRRKGITDDIPFKRISVPDIITYSSNIGIAQLTLRLSAKEIRDGLIKFGIGKKSGIDLPFEVAKPIMPVSKLRFTGNKISIGFGYGIEANFVQLLKAYNVFNNKGVLEIPRIAYEYKREFKVLNPGVAFTMLNMLREVVLKGTAKRAYIKGIFTAGKTGTAHVFMNGVYSDIYNSSFFGFANDKKHKYTIGVVFYKINMPNPYYFASHSAVPTFKRIVDIMLEENLLKVEE